MTRGESRPPWGWDQGFVYSGVNSGGSVNSKNRELFSEQSPEGEGVGAVGHGFPGSRQSKCKGPGAG